MVFPWQISFFCQLGFRNILIALSRKYSILVQKNLQQYHLLLSFIFTSFTSYAVSFGAISWMDRNCICVWKEKSYFSQDVWFDLGMKSINLGIAQFILHKKDIIFNIKNIHSSCLPLLKGVVTFNPLGTIVS